MLEIASEIVICLLLASLIGFSIGYLVCKSQSKKSIPLTQTKIEEDKQNEASTAKQPVEEISVVQQNISSVEVEKPLEQTLETSKNLQSPITETTADIVDDDEQEAPEEHLAEKEITSSEEIEIPTENAIENALMALESFKELEEASTETVNENEKPGQKPELLTSPRKGKKDDLTKIKGIGSKVEEKLNASGIYHFEQIANWTEENMLWLEAHTLFSSRAKKELWIAESKSLLQ